MKEQKTYQPHELQYIVCPDRNCLSFYADVNENFLCDGKCPKECKFYVICPICKNRIYFDPRDVSRMQRIDCNFPDEAHPGFTCNACIFTRINGIYELTYFDEENN